MKNKASTHGILVILVLLVSGLLINNMGCHKPTEDFTVSCTESEDHTHQITIIGQDVDALRLERTIVTTEAGTPPHTHTIVLYRHHFETLKHGRIVGATKAHGGTVTIPIRKYELYVTTRSVIPSNYTGYGHYHIFHIKKP